MHIRGDDPRLFVSSLWCRGLAVQPRLGTDGHAFPRLAGGKGARDLSAHRSILVWDLSEPLHSHLVGLLRVPDFVMDRKMSSAALGDRRRTRRAVPWLGGSHDRPWRQADPAAEPIRP